MVASLLMLYVLCSEFGADSDDDSRGSDINEDREKLKRRKFIMDQFRRRNQVSIVACFFYSVVLHESYNV